MSMVLRHRLQRSVLAAGVFASAACLCVPSGQAQNTTPIATSPPAVPTTAATDMPLQVAFTFDDLPAHGPLPAGMARPKVVKSILATLKRENMPPVYGFVNGFRVARFPYQIHILQAWRAAGNPLGNHTWSHPDLESMSAAAMNATSLVMSRCCRKWNRTVTGAGSAIRFWKKETRSRSAKRCAPG